MNTEDALSPREIEVARLAADGLSCPAIAKRLFISENTVKTHLKRVVDALEVHNRVHLANSLRARENHPNG